MPANLYQDVRVSVMLVGSSLSFGLVCAVYSAVFLGLQSYWIPMTLSVINRASFAAAVIVVVALRGNLVAMGMAVATVNVTTGVLQAVAWRRRASHIRVSLGLVTYSVLKTVTGYCSLQSISLVAMLCITGLDVVIVGHYDYVQTAYYSIATMPTTFALAIVGSMMGPLLPASSAMSTQRTASEMGDFLVRITRYTTVMLLLTGLPLIVCGLPLLRLWVGPWYALHTVRYLQLLVFANIVRNLCAPYATMFCATGKQKAAIASAMSEAAVNLGSSIYLASRFGAIGVALGTLLGSFVGVLLHFTVSMRLTRDTLTISRSKLFWNGLLRPAITAIPSLAFVPLWLLPAGMTLNPLLVTIWCLSTLMCAWFGGLNHGERSNLLNFLRSRLMRAAASA